jgi:hypothetical protein
MAWSPPTKGSFGLWALAAVACIRDLRHQHFGWVSVALGIVWFVTTLTVWWKLETERLWRRLFCLAPFLLLIPLSVKLCAWL